MTDQLPASPENGFGAHWRQVVAVVAPVVAVATVIQSLITTVSASAIVDGVYRTEPGWLDVMVGVVWLAAWALALAAAMIVIRGALAGPPASPREAARAALRRWASATIVIVVTAVVVAVAAMVAVALTRGLGLVALAAIAVVGFFASSLLPALPLSVLDAVPALPALGRAWTMSAGHRWAMFWRGVAIMAPAAALSWAQQRLAAWSVGTVSAFALQAGFAVATVVVILIQAGVLASWHAGRESEDIPGTIPVRGAWLPSAATLAGALLLTGMLTVINPVGVPVFSSEGISSTDPRGPFGVTADGRGVALHGGHPPVVWTNHTAAVLDDGRLVEVFHNGSGTPVQMRTCVPDGQCQESVLSGFSKPGLVWWATAVKAGSGLAVVALVQQAGTDASKGDVVLWLCPTPACTTARREVLQPGFPTAWDSFGEHGPLAVHIDRQQHIVVALATQDQQSTTIIRCADAACGRHSSEWARIADSSPTGDGRQPAIAGLGFDAADRLVAVVTDPPPAPPQPGLQITVGRRQTDRLARVITCDDDNCVNRSERAWHTLTDDAGYPQIWPVTLPDGSLVLLDGTLYHARVVTCEGDCG